MWGTFVRQWSSTGSVPRSPNSTPARLEAEPLGVGAHADAQEHVRAARSRGRPPASAAPRRLLVAFDRRRAAVLDHVHAAAQEHLLQHLRQIGVVVGEQSDRAPRSASPASRSARRSRRTRTRSARRPARPGARAGRAARTPDAWSAPGGRRDGRTAGTNGAGAGTHQQRVELHLVVALVDLHGQRVGARHPAAAPAAPARSCRPSAHARHGSGAGRPPAPGPACAAGSPRAGRARSRARPRRRGPRSSIASAVVSSVFGRDRVRHRAVAAKLILLDQRDVRAEVGGGDGGGVARRPTTQIWQVSCPTS